MYNKTKYLESKQIFYSSELAVYSTRCMSIFMPFFNRLVTAYSYVASLLFEYMNV